MTLVGSGSTTQAPLFKHWAEEFNRRNPSIHVQYFTTRSAEGIRAIGHGEGDFASGEISLGNPQRLAQIPVALVCVVPVYNVPGVGQLRFSGDLLAQIYMRSISRWDDRRIAVLNPDISLPSLPITVVSRPQGSGTRQIFIDFLCRNNPKFCGWSEQPHPEVQELIFGGSEGVARKVARTPGAIGYVDRSLALAYRLTVGSVRNSAGRFVIADRGTIYAACAAKQNQILTNPASLVDAPEDDAYPMVAFSWVYFPLHSGTSDRIRALRQFLHWCLGEGQTLVGPDRVPLPASVAVSAQARLDVILR